MKFTGGYLIFFLLCSFLCCSNSAQGSPTAIPNHKAEDNSEKLSDPGSNNTSKSAPNNTSDLDIPPPSSDKPLPPPTNPTTHPTPTSSPSPPTTTALPTPPTPTTTAAPNTTTSTHPTTTPASTTTPTHPTTTPTSPTTPSTSTPNPTPSSTAQPLTSTTPAPHHNRFDGPSFVGGIVLSLGLIAIGFIGWKYYKARSERNYRTL